MSTSIYRTIRTLAILTCLLQVSCGIFARTEMAPATVGEAGGTATPTTIVQEPASTFPTAAAARVESPEPEATAEPIMPQTFDGHRAMEIVADQLGFGPRWPGSPGHQAIGDYIVEQLAELDWQVEEQGFEYQGFTGRNLVARTNLDAGEIVILGAHYDTRRLADQTPGAAEQGLAVPGANDGASGVAVLLELARVLDREAISREIWLTFFDAEDNGGGALPGWEYSAGSPYVANSLETRPEAVVIVDMVGDSDLQLFYERNSDPTLSATLWGIASELGYAETFIPEPRYAMIDDHLAFARLGFPVALIIDFDYPYWHTVEDTLDKVGAESLHRVGRTLEVWLEEYIDR